LDRAVSIGAAFLSIVIGIQFLGLKRTNDRYVSHREFAITRRSMVALSGGTKIVKNDPNLF
jgi:hypothetical protein